MMKSTDLRKARDLISEIEEIDRHEPVARDEVALVTLGFIDEDNHPVREIDAEDPETIDAFVDLLAQRDARLPARRAQLVAELAALGVEYVGIDDEEGVESDG